MRRQPGDGTAKRRQPGDGTAKRRQPGDGSAGTTRLTSETLTRTSHYHCRVYSKNNKKAQFCAKLNFK